jgi:thioredoxin-like negative regulator of GroEL
MTPDLAASTQRPERTQQALALAVTQATQGRPADALATLEHALNGSSDRQQLTRLLIDNALPGLGRASALATDHSAAGPVRSHTAGARR